MEFGWNDFVHWRLLHVASIALPCNFSWQKFPLTSHHRFTAFACKFQFDFYFNCWARVEIWKSNWCNLSLCKRKMILKCHCFQQLSSANKWNSTHSSFWTRWHSSGCIITAITVAIPAIISLIKHRLSIVIDFSHFYHWMFFDRWSVLRLTQNCLSLLALLFVKCNEKSQKHWIDSTDFNFCYFPSSVVQ